MNRCAVCGKEFDVLYPELWRYKRGNPTHIEAWLCSWTCLREYDRRKEAKKNVVILNEEQKRKAAELAAAGGDARGYLRSLGCSNPTTSLKSVMKWAEKNMTPAEEKKESPEAEKPRVELVLDQSIAEEYRREQAAKAEPVDYEKMIREKKPVTIINGYEAPDVEVTAIRTALGEFYFDREHWSIDWRNKHGEEVSLMPEDWKELAEEIPRALRLLGAD